MRKRINTWVQNIFNKIDRMWLSAKTYSRKCRLVYERMWSI
ncbi:hypothetical protein [Flagellimonas olearia]|nr:hypothetical protein [Allomuricauda olearia]